MMDGNNSKNTLGSGRMASEDHENAEQKEKRYRPLVYICSPFFGDTEHNISRARWYCLFTVSKGFIPLAPHLHYLQFMDDRDREERELGLFFALVLLSKCDELWVFGSRISTGMSHEITQAIKRWIPIRYFNDKCEEVCRNKCREKSSDDAYSEEGI